jgi:23S rRNA pseudouridine1911/1915/1917 synthase
MSVRTRHGRASATRYVVIRCYESATVLHLFPMTGRTHQIRVHLAAIGHPVVGDRLYGRSRGQHRRARDSVIDVVEGFGRQALHAEMLGFFHPSTGRRIEIRAPLPADLRELLLALGADDEAAA